MAEKDYILKVTDLKTEFKVGKKIVHAVNGVSFNLDHGKVLGIVGELDIVVHETFTITTPLSLLDNRRVVVDGIFLVAVCDIVTNGKVNWLCALHSHRDKALSHPLVMQLQLLYDCLCRTVIAIYSPFVNHSSALYLLQDL